MENPEKRWYYVTVERVVRWNVAIEATSPDDAAAEAESMYLDYDEADVAYDPEAVNVEEVKRRVE